ncbi:MAG: biotin/lipoyl-containing protein, partial [Brachymonas sp.]
MSLVEIKVPQLSESITEATLLTWKKQPGQAVEMDEILIEVETDKVVLEVPAPAAGVLAEITAADGATVTAEQLIGKIDTAGKATAPAAATPAAAAAPVAASPAAAAPASNSKAGVAMPAAAKIMADNNLAAGAVAGTGKDGRVTKGDILGAISSGATQAGSAAQTAQKAAISAPAVQIPLGDRPEERVPMSR